MSTYIDKAINPKTGKAQMALFMDDYYGSHRYGVGFKNDRSTPSLSESIVFTDYAIYRIENIQIRRENSGNDLFSNNEFQASNSPRG